MLAFDNFKTSPFGKIRDVWVIPRMERTILAGERDLLTYAAFGLLLALSVVSSDAMAQGNAFFTRLSFAPTNGKVGYHMDATLHFWDSDIPGGSNDTCVFTTNDLKVDGKAPPGLTVPHDDGSSWAFEFEGTPRQAGDWELQVYLIGMHCYAGPFADVNYGDRTVKVQFHIDP